MTARISRETMAEQAYATLKAEIVGGTLQSGQRLLPHALSATLHISPTPVKEALLRLERARKPISVAGVARAAGVTRATVYRSPFIGEIQDAARRTASSAPRGGMKEQASEASLRRRLQGALDELARVKRQLEVVQHEKAVLRHQMDAMVLKGRVS